MEIQHEIAVKIGKFICGKNESEENRLWITYGIEVLLNEVSKFCVALLIATVLNIFWEVLFSGILLLLLRAISGGRHFKNNICCFITSDISLICPVLFAKKWQLGQKCQILVYIVIGIMLLLWTPFETNQKMGKRNRGNRKILIIIAFSVGIVIEYIIFRKDTSGGITGLVALIECLSILPKRKER